MLPSLRSTWGRRWSAAAMDDTCSTALIPAAAAASTSKPASSRHRHHREHRTPPQRQDASIRRPKASTTVRTVKANTARNIGKTAASSERAQCREEEEEETTPHSMSSDGTARTARQSDTAKAPQTDRGGSLGSCVDHSRRRRSREPSPGETGRSPPARLNESLRKTRAIAASQCTGAHVIKWA